MNLAHRLPVVLSLLLAGALPAQSLFLADLNGAQEPTASTGTGKGQVTLNILTNIARVELSASGLSSPITAAHIHLGPIGVPGGIIFPLAGTGPTWTQTIGPLTPAQLNDLRSGNWYFNVHTMTNPGGEIRGQITAADRRFDAYATGAKETPPNGSAGIGIGEFTLLPGKELQYSVSSSGTMGAVTQAHIHEGLPGVPGGIVFPLSTTGPNSFGGMTAPLTDLQIAKLRAGFYYLNIHTTTFGAGEIRGQITPSFTGYGPGCAGTAGVPNFDASGTPVPNGNLTLSLTNGLPGGSGALLFSAGADRIPLLGCNLLLAPAPILLSFPVPLDGAGSLTLPFVMPPTAGNVWLYLQFAGLDGGAPGGLSMSNGLGWNFNE